MWYAFALKNGGYHVYSEVTPWEEYLAKRMTPEQMAEAKRLAAEWTSESPCP